ncbi:G2-specific protein kinase nimA [Pseudocercospora fuligena]|uniref:non-specific serine/threonine protein kinase n=1 Tax=Pseudocercospora fuligena TaxID=685502 RepID=A0A8H6RJM1_9PEZI|nr:G2-specific protein kinase nimA [Pseudocercospora fuligena]
MHQIQQFPKPTRLQKLGSAIAMTANSAAALFTGLKVIGTTTEATLLKAEAQVEQTYSSEDSYDVLHTLAATGEGQVSFLQSRSSGAIVVRKVLRPVELNEHNRRSWDQGKFKYPNDAFIANLMKPHPNIVRVFACQRHEEMSAEPAQYEMFMEHCNGGDLYLQAQHFIRMNEEVPDSFILHATIQLIEAMAFIHHGLRYCGHGQYTMDPGFKPLVHGDIKPENIFLRWDKPRKVDDLPTLVIGDFGCAKIAGKEHHDVSVGTEMYHAPEDVAIVGSPMVDCTEDTFPLYPKLAKARAAPSDMYAIGLILECLVLGQEDPPPPGHDFTKILLPEGYRRGTYKTDYEHKQMIRLIIQTLLMVNTKARGTADFDAKTGLLEDVHYLRLIRQDMIAARDLDVDEDLWVLTPPPAVDAE